MADFLAIFRAERAAKRGVAVSAVSAVSPPSAEPIDAKGPIGAPPKKEPSPPPADRGHVVHGEAPVRYITTAAEAVVAVAELAAADTVLGFDVETMPLPAHRGHEKAGLDPHLSRVRLAQVFTGAGEAMVFDMLTVPWPILAPLWGRPLVAHNALFELKHLAKAGIRPKRMECTMLQANALTGDLPSLEALVASVLGRTIDKTCQVSEWSAPNLSPEQIAYAALDAVVVKQVFDAQTARLHALGRTRCYELMRDAQPAVASMELNGIHFDLIAHARLMDCWQSARGAAESRLRAILGPEVSPTSSPQVSDWLRRHLDAETLARWPMTPKGQLKLDADTVARFDHLPLVKPLQEFKLVSKNLSSFGEGFAAHVSPATGRIHASFRIAGARTGRFTCSTPNIQNPPRDKYFRALFSAPVRRTIVVADYGQIELRVAAIVSQDPAMLGAYAAGHDLHRMTAAAIAGIAAEQVSSGQRHAAKAVNFGLLYGQGAEGLARYAKSGYDVDMTTEQAQSARLAFFQTYPVLRRWQKDATALAERTRRSITPAGRVRDFAPEKLDNTYTASLNTPIQGGAAEILLAALARLDHHLSGLDARLVNVVHDEIVLEVAEAEAEPAKRALEAAMTEGFLSVFPDAEAITRGLVEAHHGPNWAAAKP